MKTIKSIAAAVLLLVGTSVSAYNGGGIKVNPNAISEEISELLENPSFEVLDEISITATLTVNGEGELVVLSVASEDEQVERYVKSRLNYQKLENNLTEGATYKVPIRLVSE